MVEPTLFGPYSFLRTIVIILVIFYAFRLIMRYVGPWILKKGVENMTKKAEEQMRQAQGRADASDRPEGTVTIERKPGQNKSDSDDDAEYVDFEEVK